MTSILLDLQHLAGPSNQSDSADRPKQAELTREKKKKKDKRRSKKGSIVKMSDDFGGFC